MEDLAGQRQLVDRSRGLRAGDGGPAREGARRQRVQGRRRSRSALTMDADLERALDEAGDQFDGLRRDHGPGDDHRRRSSTRAARRSTRCAAGATGYVALERTPFYLESGGQVSDSGRILGADGSRRRGRAAGAAESGAAAAAPRARRGGRVPARTDRHREVADEIRDATRRNHTATHLLHAALRQVLGPHVKQAGSLVAPDRLRFDFVHFAAVTRDELRASSASSTSRSCATRRCVTEVKSHRGGDRARGDGALRREVRRPRARRLDSRLQHGALRRHARPRHRRHRRVRHHRGKRRRRRRPPHRGADRRRRGRVGAAAAAVARQPARRAPRDGRAGRRGRAAAAGREQAARARSRSAEDEGGARRRRGQPRQARKTAPESSSSRASSS